MPQRYVRLGVVGLLLLPGVSAADADATVDLRIRQAHLTVLCLDGRPVEAAMRRWTLAPGAHTLSITMRNEPRPGIAASDPGTATIAVSLEAGHRYEIEVRAPPASYAARVWTRAEWTPVVRDRSAEDIVGAEPAWDAPSCG